MFTGLVIKVVGADPSCVLMSGIPMVKVICAGRSVVMASVFVSAAGMGGRRGKEREDQTDG